MTTSDELAPIAAFTAGADLPWDDQRAEKMARYLDLLFQFNEAMNLIGPMSRPEAVETLLLDSLVPAAARRPTGPILDVGTGAGLPGVPLKIAFPELPLTLVEPRQKRSTFLKIATHRLGLTDTEVVRARIEDVPTTPFDTVISKAFQNPTEWLATAHPFLAEQGAVLVLARPTDRNELTTKATELGLVPAGQASVDPMRITFAFGPTSPKQT